MNVTTKAAIITEIGAALQRLRAKQVTADDVAELLDVDLHRLYQITYAMSCETCDSPAEHVIGSL